ncbi:GNAT family N-acetyltransferase [Spartinivicinus ruber]|uniref:GNAT family N-acetyltransferase n=1 Tax=Spartinivicinus ruber TaxID=2683272 RepID=UPI0013D8A8CC|nr:GNAT family protein [Spartinivicinus ruber]
MFSLNIDKETALELVHPVMAKHLHELVEKNRAYLSEWLPWVNKTKSIEDYQSFINQALHDYADDKKMVCVIKYQEELVGVCGFNSINPMLKKVEIGYWLASEYQGRGIITNVCQKLIEIAFNHYNMDKVQISAAEENHKSRAVCERLGMKLEGIITNAENVDGKIVNHAIYGLNRKNN